MEVDRAGTSCDSGMWKMLKSQNQADSQDQVDGSSPDNYADFFVAYATVAGSCVNAAHL